MNKPTQVILVSLSVLAGYMLGASADFADAADSDVSQQEKFAHRLAELLPSDWVSISDSGTIGGYEVAALAVRDVSLGDTGGSEPSDSKDVLIVKRHSYPTVVITTTKGKRHTFNVSVHQEDSMNYVLLYDDANGDGSCEFLQYASTGQSGGSTRETDDFGCDGQPESRVLKHPDGNIERQIWLEEQWRRLRIDQRDGSFVEMDGVPVAVEFAEGAWRRAQ